MVNKKDLFVPDNEEPTPHLRKRKHQNLELSEPDEEELQLEKEVFGSLGIDINSFGIVDQTKNASAYDEEEEVAEQSLFVIDKRKIDPSGKPSKNQPVTEAAWVDEDDAQIVVDLTKQARLRKLRKDEKETTVSGEELERRLREQHQKMNSSRTGWVNDLLQKKSHNEEVNVYLRDSEPFLQAQGNNDPILPKGRIDISRLNDANQRAPSNAVIQSIDWHKNAQLMLTASYDKSLRIFHVDGKDNPIFHSLYLQDLQISCARFVGEAHDEIICVGRRPCFYWVDLETGNVERAPRIIGCEYKSLAKMSVSRDGRLLAFLGNNGSINIVSQKTKRVVSTMKMDGNARCAEFTPDGVNLLSGDSTGYVYKWDLRKSRCAYKHVDEGSTGTISIDVSRNGRMYATGLESGVVNVYDTSLMEGEKYPKPVKTIMNLTTDIDQVQFNHDGQILLMSSKRKKDSLKLVNLNTMSVIPFWPTSRTPLRYVSFSKFSPHSGFLACGNDRGRVLLYRLNHYSAT